MKKTESVQEVQTVQEAPEKYVTEALAVCDDMNAPDHLRSWVAAVAEFEQKRAQGVLK